MNHIFFMTHATLGPRHADLCIRALSSKMALGIWDYIHIYNSHQDEIPNSAIEEILERYDISIPVSRLPYDASSPKTVSQDILNITNFVKSSLPAEKGKILLLKSDYVLAGNFAAAIERLPPDNFVWTLPTMNAKEFVGDDEIMDRAGRQFVICDEMTYYRGSDIFEPYKEMGPVNGDSTIMDTDSRIKFVSHNIKRDLNCHVISRDVFDILKISDDEIRRTWGGPYAMFCDAHSRGVNFVDERGAFAIHVFHDIISKNRSTDREDYRKTMAGQKY